MKTSNNRRTILLAVMLAAVAAFAVYLYQSSGEEKEPTQASLTVPSTPTPRPTVDVLVATQDIGVNSTISEGMVAVKQVLPEDKNIRALSSPDEAVGRIATVALLQGEQVLSTRLADDENAATQGGTFAYNVPAGKRALSLKIDEVSGTGGLVQPGDRVDVIAYFEVVIKVPKDELFAGIGTSNDEEATEEANTGEDDIEDFEEFVTTHIVEDVEVLAVAQALSPDEDGITEDRREDPTPTPTVDPESTALATVEPEGDPVARPKALSVTLAVDPDQAQRLLLAELTAKGFRLALRTPGDTTQYGLAPAQTGPFSTEGALGDLNNPAIPSDLMITKVEIEKQVLSSGEVLEFTVTVKNTHLTRTIVTDETTPPEYSYTEGLAYDSLGFFAERGTYRIGLNVAGEYPTEFPYRWAIGKDLAPGEVTTIKGSVKLTETTPATRFWFGVIREPNLVSQDGVSVTEITVLPAAAAEVVDDAAMLRAEPNVESRVTKDLAAGDYLTVVETQDDWFRVEGPGESEGWIETAVVQVVPPASEQDVDVEASPVAATPESS